jgi:ADP-heptose:LPS heptosyltransferase
MKRNTPRRLSRRPPPTAWRDSRLLVAKQGQFSSLEVTASVIRTLAHRGQDWQALFPVLRGGSDEIELAAQVMAELDGVDALNLARRIKPCAILFAFFRKCAVALGPASGPMSIAAAVGCPVVSIWGSTAPERGDLLTCRSAARVTVRSAANVCGGLRRKLWPLP